MKIGIIGGSGLSDSKIESEIVSIQTPYGEPSCPYEITDIENINVLFLRRHGEKHNIPPHRINYRANIYGFKHLGVERIFGIFAVGAINDTFPPGSIVIPDQIIDFTQGMRKNTFYEEGKVVHIDFTEPFCKEIRDYLVKTSKKLNLRIFPTGTYVCVNGPRLETSAEIQFYKSIGSDIVGMTLMPEASLAREVEICYAGVAVVTNFAAGISKNPLTVTEVVVTMRMAMDKVKLLIKETIKNLPKERKCVCKDALKNASF